MDTGPATQGRVVRARRGEDETRTDAGVASRDVQLQELGDERNLPRLREEHDGRGQSHPHSNRKGQAQEGDASIDATRNSPTERDAENPLAQS